MSSSNRKRDRAIKALMEEFGIRRAEATRLHDQRLAVQQAAAAEFRNMFTSGDDLVDAYVAQPGHLLIAGGAGAGKTSLAKEILHRFKSDHASIEYAVVSSYTHEYGDSSREPGFRADKELLQWALDQSEQALAAISETRPFLLILDDADSLLGVRVHESDDMTRMRARLVLNLAKIARIGRHAEVRLIMVAQRASRVAFSPEFLRCFDHRVLMGRTTHAERMTTLLLPEGAPELDRTAHRYHGIWEGEDDTHVFAPVTPEVRDGRFRSGHART